MNVAIAVLHNGTFVLMRIDGKLILFTGPGNERSIDVPGVLNVRRLQELLLTLATLIKKVRLSLP